MSLVSLPLLILLSGLALAGYGGWASLEAWRWHRDRYLLPSLGGWRLALIRVGAALGCLVFTVAVVADGLNRHFSYVPSWAALFGHVSPDLVAKPLTASELGRPRPTQRLPTHGLVEHLSIPGPVSGVAARVSYVYLPPQYFDGSEPARRFPVLYLIHGSPGTAVDWLRGGYVDRTMDFLLAHDSIQPFIVVLPDANGGYRRDLECENVVGGPADQTYLATDVVNFVDARYRTIPNRADRAIGGLSTGGYCGLNLTFRHPDVFSAAVMHSGTGHPDRNLYTGHLFGGNRALRLANSPDVYLPTIPITAPTGVYMDDGADDTEALRADRRLYGMLVARGVITRWNIVRDEGHTFVAFRRNLRLSLPWVSNWFTSHHPQTGLGTVESPDDSYLPPPSLSDRGINTGPAPGLLPGAASPPKGGTPPPLAQRRPGPPPPAAPATTEPAPPPATAPSVAPTTTPAPATTASPSTTSAPTTTSAPPSPGWATPTTYSPGGGTPTTNPSGRW